MGVMDAICALPVDVLELLLPRTRMLLKEELIAQDMHRVGKVAEVAKQVEDPPMPVIHAKMEEVKTGGSVRWPNRPVEDICAATARVFPTMIVRKVHAQVIAARALVLASALSAQVDVITPFFPPACKAQSSDSFGLDNYNKVCLSVLQ